MNRRVYNEHFCECRFFWSFCFPLFLLLFIPLSDLFLSPSPTMNLIITHYFDIPPVRIGFHAISWLPPLSSRLCRSSSHPTVPYHYYEPSGPNECSMYLSHERNRRGSHHRFITEKAVFANWARTRDIHFYQPDWKPSPIVTTLQIQPDPEMHPETIPRNVKYVCGWFSAFRFPLWPVWIHKTAAGQSELLVAVSRLSKQLGRMGSLRNSSTKPQQCFGSVTLKGWISYWNQSHEGCLKCAFYTK